MKEGLWSKGKPVAIVEFKEDYEFNGKIYKKGHRFRVTGSSYRGLDLEDAEGNKICETLFINDIMREVPISEIRNDKLNELGI